jgi:hypothetical protein
MLIFFIGFFLFQSRRIKLKGYLHGSYNGVARLSSPNTKSHVVANFRVATTGREGIVSFCAS